MASSSAQDPGQDSQPEYRYLQEIAQMVGAGAVLVDSAARELIFWCRTTNLQMFVFGEVVDPHPDVLKLVEDIVRTQVIEMVS